MSAPAPAATATYNDCYAGPVAALLVPFRTKRRGETVTRFRWLQANGQGAGGFAAPFQTVARAVAAAERHASFSAVAGA